MARVIEHVRFTLTELIDAVEKVGALTSKPTVQGAFSYYWAMVLTARGWRIEAVTSQMDVRQTLINVGNGDMRNEEFWNVILSSEDATGTCDLVAEAESMPEKPAPGEGSA